MSFKNYGGYQATSSGDASNEFSRISQSIGTNIQKIGQNVNSMQRMVNQLGTPQDSESLRSQLHQLQHYTNQLAKDTNSHLKEISLLPQSLNPSDQKQRKMLCDRLTSDFSEVLRNFQVIQRTAAQKEKESVTRARALSKLSHEDEPNHLIDLHSVPQTAAQHQIQMEEEVDLEELREREQSIKKIESDIVDVNQIFKDLATMVHTQGEMIDSIEANVESAAIQVQDGATQISKARDYQSRARKKMFFLILFLVMLIVVIGVIIYLST